MLSKAKIKLVQSLKDKKQRQIHGLFVVEGNKIIAEMLHSKIRLKTLFATTQWIQANRELIAPDTELIEVSTEELQRLAFSITPQDVLALAFTQYPETILPASPDQLTLALDTIQDPGNMGTIIRLADWYGIRQIICSPGCADLYNPKVIQASMGSFLRVNVYIADLKEWLESNPDIPVYGAMMQGESIYTADLRHGILLIGNEGKGIQSALLPLITKPVTIPRTGQAESLNAAIATAILLDNRARQLS
ncbi:MAG: RNA methyltransferase [Bacteroidia bacterium]|jgi:TrmH family RNA methyltransferase